MTVFWSDILSNVDVILPFLWFWAKQALAGKCTVLLKIAFKTPKSHHTLLVMASLNTQRKAFSALSTQTLQSDDNHIPDLFIPTAAPFRKETVAPGRHQGAVENHSRTLLTRHLHKHFWFVLFHSGNNAAIFSTAIDHDLSRFLFKTSLLFHVK